MPDFDENKKRKKRSSAISNEKVNTPNDPYDDYDPLLDDEEVPIRLTRKRKSGTSAKGTSSSRKNVYKKRRKKKLWERFKAASTPEKYRNGRNNPNGDAWVIQFAKDLIHYKPMHFHFPNKPDLEIRFWPLYLVGLLFIALILVPIQGSTPEIKEYDVTIVGLPEELEGYRIMVLSDLNGKTFGDSQSTLIRNVNNQSYNLLLCVGDMVGEKGNSEPFLQLLQGISRPSRVYFLGGDSDPGPYLSVPRDIEGTMQQMILEDWILEAMALGAHYVDYPISIKVGESTLWLTPTSYMNIDAYALRNDWLEQTEQEKDGVVSGITRDYNSLPVTSYRYALAKKFYQLISEIQKDDIIIGMSHIVPSDEYILSSNTHSADSGKYLYTPDLIISGHYCGGVVRIPLIGALYVPNSQFRNNGWFPKQKKVSGFSTIGLTQTFITRGLSTTSAIPFFHFRLFNQPEIAILTLTAKLPDSLLD